MADYSSPRSRVSVRGAIARIAKEEAGKSVDIDYHSHPLDRVTDPKPALVEAQAHATRKRTRSDPTTLIKKISKPAPRKRRAGTGPSTTKSQSHLGHASEDQMTSIFSQYPKATAHYVGPTTSSDPNEKHLNDDDNGFSNHSDSDSDLSELGTTPECPSPALGAFDASQVLNDIGDQTQLDFVATNLTAQDSSYDGSIPNAVSASEVSKKPSHATWAQQLAASTPAFLPPLKTGPVEGTVVEAPSISPITPKSLRHSGRSKAPPTRPSDLLSTPVEEVEISLPLEAVSGGDSPTARKVSRKAESTAGNPRRPARPRESINADKTVPSDGTVSKTPRRKKPVSPENIEANDLAQDIPIPAPTPAPNKAPRKRKAETNSTLPRKRQVKTESATDETPAMESVDSKSTVQRKRKERTPAAQQNAQLSLPSPPMSHSDYLEASGLPIDPGLLEFSRVLTMREPIESKDEPRGKPEVWAPGRQELCETLPYYKSAHSGCYANGNTIYAFMFDSAGVGREYMDGDVIIARMGGHMESDTKTHVVSQKDDHEMEAKQPQSVLNNIIHQNPVVIICGDKNVGAPTKIPYRYCVLGWFKPTHVWAEKTIAKKKIMTTIRYRFERLSRAEPSWYSPASSDPPRAPSDLVLPIKTCAVCSQTCPQVFLIDWMCTNPRRASFWVMSNGQDAPFGELDYHPAFLLHQTKWQREEPPFSVNPGVPQIGHHFGDNLSHVNTRGIVCPLCGRCNSRYLFTHWRCDTPGCRWKLQSKHEVVMPSNLCHTPWEMASDGPSLVKSVAASIIRTQVKYYSNYKVLRYTFDGVKGSVIVAKANKHVVSVPGGADDMFREVQTVDLGLERRMLRKSAPTEVGSAIKQADHIEEALNAETVTQTKDEMKIGTHADEEEDDDNDHNAEAGTRMTAFGMNFGMPYKFIARGDSRSFETAPAAIRNARSLLNWAQHVFVNDPSGYQDFNEELIFGYMDGQNIKYHDDGEMGLGSRIATLSLGGGATMLLRIKAKYYSQVSNTGVFTYEEPLPLPLLESSGYTSGHKGKKIKKPCKDTHEGRRAAWVELKQLKEAGDGAAFRKRSKELSKELELRRAAGEPLLSFHLTHGDIVIMKGEDIQKFLEHQVEPTGSLRFALTCRTVLENHLTPDQLPKYEVADAEYDGKAIREAGDGEAVVWD